jgi:hypothetical protein
MSHRVASVIILLAGQALCACIPEPAPETHTIEQDGMNMQGMNMQGMNMQGITLQGMSMLGFELGSATLSGAPLGHLHVDRGELVADGPLRGTALVGAQLVAQVRNLDASPPATALVTYRITAISAERSQYDPTGTGHTFVYTLEQRVDDTGTWQTACPADADGHSIAIPLAAVWDEHGDRSVPAGMFTFGCTSGVIAKCYRWGYRPWVTGFGDLVPMHQTCTRLARADYCGIGIPHTRNGTTINVWDTLPSPGPIQHHGTVLGLPLPPPGMLFEAGWNTDGAVCLSHSRWILQDGLGIAALCPHRLVPPGLLGETVCDTVSAVLGIDTGARMFNEAYLNLIGP